MPSITIRALSEPQAIAFEVDIRDKTYENGQDIWISVDGVDVYDVEEHTARFGPLVDVNNAVGSDPIDKAYYDIDDDGEDELLLEFVVEGFDSGTQTAKFRARSRPPRGGPGHRHHRHRLTMTATRNVYRETTRWPAADVAALDRQLEEIRERNVERSARRLDASGELTERCREALVALGDALVRRILGSPVENMAADDREIVRVGRDMLGVD